MKKSKKIPLKNYLLAFIIFFITVFIFIYFFMWHSVKQKEKLLESYLIKTNTVSYVFNNLNDLEVSIKETPSKYFIFTGYTKDLNLHKTETRLKKIIDDFNINDIFYYLDITDYNNDATFLSNFNKLFNISLYKFPAIIYVEEDEVKTVIKSDKNNSINLNHLKNILKNFNNE